MVTTLCGLPLFSVSSIILYHVAWKIKWFHILQTWYQPILRLQLRLYTDAGGVGGHLRHGDRFPPPGEEYMGMRPSRACPWPCRGFLTSRPLARKMVR